MSTLSTPRQQNKEIHAKNETFSFSKERAFHLIPSMAIFFSLSCFTKANRKKCLKIYSFTLRFVGSCLKGNKLEENSFFFKPKL
jgi:hypothetical protein